MGLFVLVKDLGETEINDFQVSIFSDQNVLLLQISMNDVERVEVTDGQGNLNGVELHDFFWEPSLFQEMLVKLSSSDKGENEVDSCVSLEHEVHAYKELVLNFKHHISLELSGIDLVRLNQNIFSDSFHCIESTSIV